MKKRLLSKIMVAGFLLIGTCFEFGNPFPHPTRALSQGDGDVDGRDFLIWQRNIGIAPEQMARLTLANFSAGRQAQPLSFQVSVFDLNGTRVFMSDRIEVPATTFRQLDVRYDEFGMDFEAGTGRKQRQMVVHMHDVVISNISVSGQKSPNLSGSLELIDPTGKTTIYQAIDDLLVNKVPTR